MSLYSYFRISKPSAAKVPAEQVDAEYKRLTQLANGLLEQIAGGEQPENIPYETLADYARFVNLQAAERIGIEVSDDILAAYKVLVEADGTSHFGE